MTYAAILTNNWSCLMLYYVYRPQAQYLRKVSERGFISWKHFGKLQIGEHEKGQLHLSPAEFELTENCLNNFFLFSCCWSLIGSEFFFNQSETRRRSENKKIKINRKWIKIFFIFWLPLLTNSSLFIFFPPNLSVLILLYKVIEFSPCY